MRYWVFHEQMLAAALAEHEARRMREGATEQQAKGETIGIATFLASPEAEKLAGRAKLVKGRP